MDLHHDVFHALRMIKAFDNTQFTATATNTLVLDRRTYSPNVKVGFLLTANLATTADATNYFDFKLFEAAEKTSTTALTSGTAVAAANLSGWSRNGTLDENSLTWPRINATTDVGDVFWQQYKGTQNVLQIRPTETSTADVTVSGIWVLYNGETQNLTA